MDAFEAILSRRSVRKFKPDGISEELVAKLVEAGAAAPSACNKRPIRLYAVTNERTLEALDKAGFFTRMPSPLVIVVAGDMNKTLPRSMSDYWIQDAAAATENILIAATAAGLGSCWNGVYLQKRVMDKVSDVLSLGEEVIPFSLIHIGYADEAHSPHSGYDPDAVTFIK